MGAQAAKPIQLIPAPGFKKIKANQVPGYEKYDFGNYQIWGPYKKTIKPGPFGSTVWADSPLGKTVDGALVLESCNLAPGLLKPRPDGTVSGTLLQSYSSFSTKPNVGTEHPACYSDNMTIKGDDGLFYIHYKHPMFARIFRGENVRSGWSGLIPTLLQGKTVNKARDPSNILNVATKRPGPPSSLQNFLEIGYLASKGQKALNGVGHKSLPTALAGPLDQAVHTITRRAAIFNYGARTLGGRRSKGRPTRKRESKANKSK